MSEKFDFALQECSLCFRKNILSSSFNGKRPLCHGCRSTEQIEVDSEGLYYQVYRYKEKLISYPICSKCHIRLPPLFYGCRTCQDCEETVKEVKKNE